MPSMPRPGGLPASTITSEVPAARRWKPLASAIIGAASPEPERASTRSMKVRSPLPGAVEQRQPAVAMAEEAQHRRHAVDGGDQLGRRAALGRRQRRAHVEQMAQHGELQMRRALGHDAVMHDVALHEPRQPRQRLLEALLVALAVAQEGQVGEDQRLQRRHRLVADQAGARRALEMRALAGEREARGGRRSPDRPPSTASRSGGSTRRCARPGRRAARWRATSAIRDWSSRRPGGRRAGRRAGSPQSRRSRSQPKPFRASSHSAGAPARCHGGSSDSGATAPELPRARSSPSSRRWPRRRIARPGIGRHGEEALGRAVAQGQGIEAGGEQPAAEFAALAGRRLGRTRRGGPAGHGADGPGAGRQRLTGPSHV